MGRAVACVYAVGMKNTKAIQLPSLLRRHLRFLIYPRPWRYGTYLLQLGQESEWVKWLYALASNVYQGFSLSYVPLLRQYSLFRWSLALFTASRKKGTRRFFRRFQLAAIELFTFVPMWRGKCTLPKLWPDSPADVPPTSLMPTEHWEKGGANVTVTNLEMVSETCGR